MADERAYLYLARRNRRGVRVLLSFPAKEKIHGTRMSDIRMLGLDTSLERDILLLIYDNRMLWEPWIETALGYADLVRSLRRRGFHRIPHAANPIFEVKSWRRMPITRAIPKKQTMLKRRPTRPS